MYTPLKIEVTEEWPDWWFKKGEKFYARRSEIRITIDGNKDQCHCEFCSNLRRNKRLYQTYQILGGERDGLLIPIVCCEEEE